MQHVQDDDADHHAGTPMMEAAHEASGGEFGEDVAKAAVRFTCGWRVVQGEHDAGEDLDKEQEHGDAAEDLMPTAGSRNIFV